MSRYVSGDHLKISSYQIIKLIQNKMSKIFYHNILSMYFSYFVFMDIKMGNLEAIFVKLSP